MSLGRDGLANSSQRLVVKRIRCTACFTVMSAWVYPRRFVFADHFMTITSKTSLKSLWLAVAAVCSSMALADEGQWQPYQMPALSEALKQRGISISGEQLADLNQYPMNAIVSLGYCSASFVSPKGLVITNHHCAYGAIQQNSTATRNLIEQGFLAKSLPEELPAGPQERLYVTEEVRDVSSDVVGNLAADMPPRERYEVIERNRKRLIQQCELDANYRCNVVSFHHGMEYFLIKQLMIQDVRLVYAPAESVGNFGGDIDNYEYPRHTGDFTFIRGYVGKDGKPAPYHVDNVPYVPKHYLKVNRDGVQQGDGILLAGYPGVTSRYRLAEEISFARDWQYPAQVKTFAQMIATIERLGQQNPELKVRYASVVKGYHNRMKKLKGLLDGFKVTDIPAIKVAQAAEFERWLAADPSRASYQKAIVALKDAVKTEQANVQQNYYFEVAKRSDLLKTAIDLHRLALEQQKPDEMRDIGYQNRDLKMFEGRLKRLEKSFSSEVDIAVWTEQLAEYLAQDAKLRVAVFDKALGVKAGATAAQLQQQLAAWYKASNLTTTEGRLAWLGKTPADFAASQDPFIKLAVAIAETNLAIEEREKALAGTLSVLRPAYMNAVIAYNRSLNKPVYPDANGTLRITYGHVDGYPAADGVYKTPFTSVSGMLAKVTDKPPFDVPTALRQAYQAKQYGSYFYKTMAGRPFNSIPLNFLSSADTTGGNSGSAVMNGRGELVGLNFDSTYESITKDWYFNPAITRAIHVDIRYVLWLMDEVDHAENLLAEMTIVGNQAK